jgi:hypothetical protein
VSAHAPRLVVRVCCVVLRGTHHTLPTRGFFFTDVPSAAGSAGQLQLGEAANLFGLSDDLLPNEQPFSIQIGIHHAFCGFKGTCACRVPNSPASPALSLPGTGLF